VELWRLNQGVSSVIASVGRIHDGRYGLMKRKPWG
jgi:hypothetical protein